ncbi:MAG TPA: PAS domain S-box protein [Bryobacteraceae bacterium]|nr:PAS domain S-box protein [Bryobacteraceae bacterium]
MPSNARTVRGLLFAIAFAVSVAWFRGPLLQVAPPRDMEIFLLGIAVTAFISSWAPALVLFLVSLPLSYWIDTGSPLVSPAVSLARFAIYTAGSLGIIYGIHRLRQQLSYWRTLSARQRESEEALRESEALTRSVVYSAVDGIITIDERGLIRSFNPAAEKLFGYAAEDVIGRNVGILMPSPFREQHDGYLRRYVETRTPRVIGVGRELVGLRRDGSTFPLELAISETILPDRRMFTGIIRDVTQRKQAEEAIREANETLRAVIATAPLAICVMDLDGMVKSWNSAAERIFGWTEAEVLGGPLPFVQQDSQQQQEFLDGMESARRGELYAGVERRRQTKAGVPVDIAIWNEVLRSREGAITGILSVIADVTEKRRLEEQLRQAMKMEAIGRLAGGVAHDFNNILTVITGYGQMLAERVPLDEEMRADVDEILRAADHAGALTSQLLVFSRHKVSNPQTVSLSEIISRLQKMLRRMIGEDMELVTFFTPDLGKVRADPAQIEQVVLNLVVNARDAMPTGGKLTIETENVELDHIYARRHIGVKPGHYAMLAVSDTGTGMDAETRLRLFEPFFTTKEKGKGTGLGLSTVYGIVKQCGGEIWVYSEIGRGTTFKIYLPLVTESEPALAAPTLIEPAAGGAETVLLVEDEAVVRKLVRNILAEQGYNVLESPDPHDALRVCQQHPETIDLLLTDVVMPHMSGRDLADRALGLRPDMRVLYMSGYTDNVIVHHGIVSAGTPFLQKPFTPASLIRKVRQVLDTE